MVIYSDSQYVVNCVFKRWLWNWENRGEFKNRKNYDLLIQYKNLYEEFKFPPKIIHIKGHQKGTDDFKVNGNRTADLLAQYSTHSSYDKDLDFGVLK